MAPWAGPGTHLSPLLCQRRIRDRYRDGFRLFPTPKQVKSLWVTFPTLESAVSAMYEVMTKEYACGATVMGPGCWTHCLYSSQHWQEGQHFIKATQDINLIGMSFRGSEAKVAFERKACIRILESTRRQGDA